MPSSDLIILAFSMIQCSCMLGEVVSAKQPDVSCNSTNMNLTLQKVQQTSLGRSSCVADGRLEVLELRLDVRTALGSGRRRPFSVKRALEACVHLRDLAHLDVRIELVEFVHGRVSVVIPEVESLRLPCQLSRVLSSCTFCLAAIWAFLIWPNETPSCPPVGGPASASSRGPPSTARPIEPWPPER